MSLKVRELWMIQFVEITSIRKLHKCTHSHLGKMSADEHQVGP